MQMPLDERFAKFSKPKEKKKRKKGFVLCAWVRQDMYEWVSDKAGLLNISMSEIVRRAVQKYRAN